jgi:translation initiation factor 3 subunit M
MSVPVFIEIEQIQQLAELKAYLKSKGVEISEENVDVETSLSQVVAVSDQLWKEGTSDADLELVFNGIIALVMVQSFETGETLINQLCEKLRAQSGDKRNALRLKLLNTLFHGLEESSPLRYVVYMSLVKLAGQADMLHLVNPKLDEIRTWTTQWDVGTAKLQTLLRAIYDAFTECKQSDRAAKVMLELLGTYTEENASQAREDAHRCIVTSLADPNTLLFDHLLTLKPVKFLEGELIHDLLTIFVTGKIKQYMQFYTANKDFVTSLGLSHEDNMYKMRLLTFMQIAEGKTELSYETIQRELDLESDEVESFIIDMVRTKAVKAKMEQPSKRVLIGMTTNRTFGRPQWQQLHDQLKVWQLNVSQVLGGFVKVQQMAHQQQQQQQAAQPR